MMFSDGPHKIHICLLLVSKQSLIKKSVDEKRPRSHGQETLLTTSGLVCL